MYAVHCHAHYPLLHVCTYSVVCVCEVGSVYVQTAECMCVCYVSVCSCVCVCVCVRLKVYTHIHSVLSYSPNLAHCSFHHIMSCLTGV